MIKSLIVLDECFVCDPCMRLAYDELRNPLRVDGLRPSFVPSETASQRSPADCLATRYFFLRCQGATNQREEATAASRDVLESQLAAMQKSLADAVRRLTNLEEMVNQLKLGGSPYGTSSAI